MTLSQFVKGQSHGRVTVTELASHFCVSRGKLYRMFTDENRCEDLIEMIRHVASTKSCDVEPRNDKRKAPSKTQQAELLRRDKMLLIEAITELSWNVMQQQSQVEAISEVILSISKVVDSRGYNARVVNEVVNQVAAVVSQQVEDCLKDIASSLIKVSDPQIAAAHGLKNDGSLRNGN